MSSLAQTAQSAVELGALAVLSTPVIRAVFGTSDKKASVAETHQTFDTDPEVHLAHSSAVSSTPVIQEDQEEKEEESTSIPPTPKIETEEETKSLPPPTPAPVEQEQERKFTPDPSAKTVELAPALALDSLPPVGRTTHTYPTPNFTHLHASNAGKQQEDDTTSSVSAYTSESRRNSSSDLKTLPTVVASSAQVDEGVIPKSETTPSTPNQENNHNSNEMGIFSAFSGNIAAPDKRKSISRSNTAKTTGTTATTEPLVGATGDRNVAVPAQGVDATYNENNTATVEPTTATTDGVSERAVSPSPRTPATVAKSFVATERPSYEETRDPVVAPNGIESGVPVTEEGEGKYEGATTNGYPARPSYNDDQPSRSYIKTNRNDATPSVRNIALPVTEEEIIQRAPAVLERDADGNPTRIDTTIASPANMGDREHLGGVITLPAGGALLPGGMAYADKEPHTAETVDESDIATERAPTERAPTERAVSQRAPSVRSRETKEERPVTPVVVEEHKAPTTIAPSVYTQHEEPKVRDLMHEGQAYRQDGSVPGQPQQQQYQDQTFSSAPVLNDYAPIGGATAGGAMSHGNAVNYEQQQHNQNQQQQRFSGPPQTQQFIQQQQPQQYRNDPSFAAERAMSPGPEMGMNRLTIAEPMRNGQSQVGPSPGPPIAPFQPTATPVSPTKSVGSNGLDRSNTYRTGVSRGNTISRRGGAFANGSALSGGGVAEAYGREDIHNRNDLATRNLIAAGKPGAAVSRKISSAEKKDAKRMSKLIVNEGKTEAAAVRGAMKELEQLQKVQKAAAIDELKAQKAQTKALQVHDKAYKKFLKHKEVYDRIEADLRSREEQYEATRQHAQAQTEILAQKNAELNDLRAQKAADDREREMRLLALKNPGAA